MQLDAIQISSSLKSAHTCKIGKIFKERRSLMSLSEFEVASKTFINVNYIQAIESGDYSNFPARVFALQYFKKYADFLDIKIDFFDIYNPIK
jgi:cytoskeletal protein RodZ